MAELDIVGLGMACLDLLVRMRELPDWEMGTTVQAFGLEGGGPVATALAAASKLGAKVGFIGTYGSDRLGSIKVQTLSEYRIDISHAQRLPGPENQCVLVCVNAENGDRVFSGSGEWQKKTLRVEDLDREYITSAKFLHLDGYHVEAALQAALWMKAAGKKVMLDGSTTHGPIPMPMRKLVEAADVLICGQGFGPSLTGCSDLFEVGKAILSMGPGIVVQTEGEDGSYTVTPQESFHTPAYAVDVVDTTGAGDVFHGAYLVGLLNGWDVRTIARFSTAVAGIKCSSLGGRGGIPTMNEALSFIETRSGQAKFVKE